MKVLEAKYISDYTISVTFEDGISGKVDLSDLVKKGIFKILQDKKQFSKVYSTGYSIAWSADLEIDATTIYAEISGKDFGDIIHPTFSYATN